MSRIAEPASGSHVGSFVDMAMQYLIELVASWYADPSTSALLHKSP